MVNPNSPHSDRKPLIRRGKVEFVNLYEVKEHELELLEKGSGRNTAIELSNFSVFNCIHMYSCFNYC